MTDKEYEDALNRIPHLNLTSVLPIIPLAEIQTEVKYNINKLCEFDYASTNPVIKQSLAETWHGFSIIDITSDGEHMIDYYSTGINNPKVVSRGIDLDEQGFAKTKVTNIGDTMPVTVNYIKSFLNEPGRCRVSRLKAGKVIHYHSHYVKASENKIKIAKSNLNRATIHIPLITNDLCNFLVTELPKDNKNYADWFKAAQLEYKQFYAVKEIWMFNSYHYHRAENLGITDRDHILIYFDYMDEKIRPYIESAINEYRGPLIRST
jgi:hypothetical protein